jgi:hypothetical protein
VWFGSRFFPLATNFSKLHKTYSKLLYSCSPQTAGVHVVGCTLLVAVGGLDVVHLKAPSRMGMMRDIIDSFLGGHLDLWVWWLQTCLAVIAD